MAKDTGLNVRKRVIRLLKKLYEILPEEQARTEICRKLLWRVKDEDSNIKVRALSLCEVSPDLKTTPGSCRFCDRRTTLLAIKQDYRDKAIRLSHQAASTGKELWPSLRRRGY